MAWRPRVTVWLLPVQPPYQNPQDTASFTVDYLADFATAAEAKAQAGVEAQAILASAGVYDQAADTYYPEHRVGRARGDAVQV